MKRYLDTDIDTLIAPVSLSQLDTFWVSVNRPVHDVQFLPNGDLLLATEKGMMRFSSRNPKIHNEFYEKKVGVSSMQIFGQHLYFAEMAKESKVSSLCTFCNNHFS